MIENVFYIFTQVLSTMSLVIFKGITSCGDCLFVTFINLEGLYIYIAEVPVV